MKITQLEVINFKKIMMVNIDPQTKKPIILTGDNAQGKSSILDAIVQALNNKATSNPIRVGADKAQITLRVDGEDQNYTIKRSITQKGSYLEITTSDGKKVPQAQKFLNALIGNLAFDPEEFARMKPKDQALALKVASGLDTSDLDSEYERLFSERTVINRQKNEAEAAYNSSERPGALVQPVIIGDILQKRELLEEDVRKHKELSELIDSRVSEISDLEEKLEKLKEDLANSISSVNEINIEESKEQLSSINEEVNKSEQRNNDYQKYKFLKQEFDHKKKVYQDKAKLASELNSKLDKIKSKKESMIKNAIMPVQGMRFNDDGVYFNDVLFSDLNTAKKIEISTMIAMSQNPDLKVIIIREGALINKSNLNSISKLAEDKGYQIWIEKFQEEPGGEGLHIIDGNISHVDGELV